MDMEEIESEEDNPTTTEPEFEVDETTVWTNPDGSQGRFTLRVAKEAPALRQARKARSLDNYRACKLLVQELQDIWIHEVKFNRRQCRLVVNQYAESFSSLIAAIEHWVEDPQGLSEDDVVAECCEVALLALMQVMVRGVALVRDCTREDWWVSVLIRSECASFATHIALHLEDFVSYVDTLKISFAEATRNASFAVPLKPDRTQLSALVEEASREDNEETATWIVECIIADVGGGTTVKSKLARCFMQVWSGCKALSLESGDVIDRPGADIGKGASGSVRIATWNGHRVAVKLIDSIPGNELQFQDEATVLESLAHPNVVKLIGVVDVENLSPRELVLELMSPKNLRSLINTLSKTPDGRRNSPFPLNIAIDIMLQIATAMRYMHEHGFLHCDLKANNVLLVVDDDGLESSLRFKVADFGLSRRKINNSAESHGVVALETAGTPGWMPPEFFERRENVPYSEASDVYSFAVTCSEILTGEVPFENVHPDNLYPKLVAGERPSLPHSFFFPDYLSHFIGSCWAQKPEQRPSFDQICETLWFCRGYCLRNEFPDRRRISASALACVNEHDAWAFASQLGFEFCLRGSNDLPFSRESEYYPLIYAATQGVLSYNREDLSTAQVLAGRYYSDWTGAGQDWPKAVTLFQAAAEKGHPEALWRLGLCYELGIGNPRETEIHWPVSIFYQMAMDGGCGSARVELGLCHALGRGGLPRDLQAAVRCWKAAKLEQVTTRQCLPSIAELVHHVTVTDPQSLDSEIIISRGRAMAGQRLRELTSARSVARRLVAGPGNCNVGPLLQADHDNNRNSPDQNLAPDLACMLQSLAREKRVGPTLQKHNKSIRARGSYWNVVDSLSIDWTSLSGFLNGSSYFLIFVVILPVLLFLFLGIAFRASGIWIVLILLVIAPLSYLLLLFLLVVDTCILPVLLFLFLGIGFRASGIWILAIAPLLYLFLVFLVVVYALCSEDSDEELSDQPQSDSDKEFGTDQQEESNDGQQEGSEMLQRLLDEVVPEEGRDHVEEEFLEDSRSGSSEIPNRETEDRPKISDSQFLPSIVFFTWGLLCLFDEWKLGLACLVISMLYLFGIGFYREKLRKRGPDSDSDDDDEEEDC